MDTETRAAFAALHTALREGLDGLRAEMTAGQSSLRGEMKLGMDGLREVMVKGFTRTDHFFELQQGQFVEFRTEVRGEFAELKMRVHRLERTLQG